MTRENRRIVGMVPVVLVLLAWAFAVPAAAPAPPAASGDLDELLRDLESYALEIWDPAKVPGMAYAVVRGSETVYARGFGKRSQDAFAGPVDADTLFEVGSCTKAFNAAMVGTVVDEGKAAWSDRVREHLPDFRMNDPWVTREFLVEDLMAQRSGMPATALDMMPFLGFTRKDVERSIRLVKPVTSFRSSYAYQNNLHMWAAELVEKKTGLVWEEAVRQRILEPLGMSDSTFDFATYDANPNHTLGHIPLDEGGLWTIPPDWPYRGWLTVYAPTGGLCSTVNDMAKWVALQLGNGSFGGKVLLRPETVVAIRAPRIWESTAPDGVASYAMGWMFQSAPLTPWYWHNGETIGMHAIVGIYPECGLGLVVLTNASGHKIPECMAARLIELYFGAEHRPCPFPPPSAPSPAGPSTRPAAPTAIPAAKLPGTYSNPAYTKAFVRKEPGGLTMTLGPARRTGPLSAVSGDSYRFDWPDWPGFHSTVTFKADASGKVTKLTIAELADVDGGDFKRAEP